jgi:hypothetical protein
MNHSLLSLLSTSDALLGLGVCLAMVGLVLRGFARTFRRDLARRKEHLRDERKSDATSLGAQLDQPPGWLERNFGLLANLVLVTGVIVATVALGYG